MVFEFAAFLLDILECMKGRHSELIKPPQALKHVFERYLENLHELPVMLKILCILHRALQEEEISESVANDLKLD